jgi:hypothetical protein
VKHLTHHFWLTDDGATLCEPCGATYRDSVSEVIMFSVIGTRLFMERHRACGRVTQVAPPQRVAIPYRVIPNKPERSAAPAVDVPASVDHADLAEHYARACRGDKTRALLMALDAGLDFTRVVGAFGDDGVAISFQCLLNGWIDRGRITDAGRVKLQRGADA